MKPYLARAERTRQSGPHGQAVCPTPPLYGAASAGGERQAPPPGVNSGAHPHIRKFTCKQKGQRVWHTHLFHGEVKGSGASVEFKGNGLDLLDLTIQIVGSVVAEVPEPLRPYVIKKIQDKIPDAVQNDLEAQGKAAPAEKKEKPPVGETVGFRMARQFAETEPGFKDFIMALADKLSNG